MESLRIRLATLFCVLALGCQGPIAERSDTDLKVADQLVAELNRMGLQASPAHYDKIIDDYSVSVVTQSSDVDDVANTLAKVPASLTLTFSGTAPTPVGVESLGSLANLVHVGFRDSKLTSGLIDSLAIIKPLRSLEFFRCEYIQDSRSKVRFPPMLTTLKMNGVNADMILANVEPESLAHLTEIDGREAQFTEIGLAQVSYAKSLTTLLLSTADIGDQDLRHLTKLSVLRTLELNNARLTYQGLRMLTGIASLEKIAFRNSELAETDKCINELKKFPNLQTLDLTGTNLDSRKVQDALPLVLVQP